MLKPYAEGEMREHAVSRAVNSPNAEPEGLPLPTPEEEAVATRAAAHPAPHPPRQQSLFD